jgi:hypothetical protein
MANTFSNRMIRYLVSIYPSLGGSDIPTILITRFNRVASRFSDFDDACRLFLQRMNKYVLQITDFMANVEIINQAFREIGIGSLTCFRVLHEIDEKEFKAINEATTFYKKSYPELVEMFRPGISECFTYESNVNFSSIGDMLFESVKRVIEKFFIFIIGCDVPIYRLCVISDYDFSDYSPPNPSDIMCYHRPCQSISSELVSEIITHPNPAAVIDKFSENYPDGQNDKEFVMRLKWLSWMKHPLYRDTIDGKELLKMKCLFIYETLKPFHDDLMQGCSVEKFMQSDPDFCCIFGHYFSKDNPFKTINIAWNERGYWIGLHSLLKRRSNTVRSHSQFKVNVQSMDWTPQDSLTIEI